jgi:alanine dehydrogenase
MADDEHLANGLNVSGGKIRHQAVPKRSDLEFVPI